MIFNSVHLHSKDEYSDITHRQKASLTRMMSTAVSFLHFTHVLFNLKKLDGMNSKQQLSDASNLTDKAITLTRQYFDGCCSKTIRLCLYIMVLIVNGYLYDITCFSQVNLRWHRCLLLNILQTIILLINLTHDDIIKTHTD